MILTPLQNLPMNVEDLGKLIVAKGFKKLPKVQKIAQSGHTGCFLLTPKALQIKMGYLQTLPNFCTEKTITK